MRYEKDNPKNKMIAFRIDMNGYQFLKEMSDLTKIEISDLLRKIIFVYFMEYFMNPHVNLTDRYKQAKKKFLETFTDEYLESMK